MEKKYLLCVGKTESHIGAINYLCAKLKNDKDSIIELFIAIEQPEDNSNFFGSSESVNSDELIKSGNDILIKNKSIIESKITNKVLLSIHIGHLHSVLSQRMLNDKDISAIVLGASHSSLEKSKTISKLIDNLGSMIVVPLIIIPQDITDEQILRLV